MEEKVGNFGSKPNNYSVFFLKISVSLCLCGEYSLDRTYVSYD
jgi:hypothetical protein